VGKIAERAVYRNVFFNNIALYFECRINKNVLLHIVFLAIFPTGLVSYLQKIRYYTPDSATQCYSLVSIERIFENFQSVAKCSVRSH